MVYTDEGIKMGWITETDVKAIRKHLIDLRALYWDKVRKLVRGIDDFMDAIDEEIAEQNKMKIFNTGGLLDSLNAIIRLDALIAKLEDEEKELSRWRDAIA